MKKAERVEFNPRSALFEMRSLLERRYVTGIDWSGDAGLSATSSKRFVIAAVHFDIEHLADASDALNRLRRAIRLPNYVFKYSKSSEAIREATFKALEDIEFETTILVDDKATWINDRHRVSGTDREAEIFAETVVRMPRRYVEEHRILVDLERGNQKVAIRFSKAANTMLAARACDYRLMKQVKPIPDDSNDGLIIQIADMVAGRIQNEFDGVKWKLPPKLDKRLNRIVV